MPRKDSFKKGEELILSTCNKDGDPNANIVISLGFVDNKLLRMKDIESKLKLGYSKGVFDIYNE